MSISLFKTHRTRIVRAIASTAIAGSVGVAAALSAPQIAMAATPHCNTDIYYLSTEIDNNVDVPAYNSTRICTLVSGDTGVGVRILQVALIQCYRQNIDTDGQFGPATERALKYAQHKEGVTADGSYGNNTRKAMHFPIVSDGPDRSCYRTS